MSDKPSLGVDINYTFSGDLLSQARLWLLTSARLWKQVVAAVMLHANTGDVEHVLVNGEFRKQDFRLVVSKLDWTGQGFGRALWNHRAASSPKW